MYDIEVAFYREGDAWVAQALNVDVSSFGDTYEDAHASIKEALYLYFECGFEGSCCAASR